MALRVETQECYPKETELFGMKIPAPEPAHDRCAKGHTMPGLLGGWRCPCPCHHKEIIEGTADNMPGRCDDPRFFPLAGRA